MFVELTPGWVAQITLQGTTDADEVSRKVIETLSGTTEEDCCWPSSVPGSER